MPFSVSFFQLSNVCTGFLKAIKQPQKQIVKSSFFLCLPKFIFGGSLVFIVGEKGLQTWASL
jgi:hypothetical protein